MALSTGTVSDPRSDADLLLAARAREAAAFGVLYERHAGAALVVARQYTAGSAQAEDVVSDAFAAVLSALQSGSGPTDSFRAYLFTVVRRVAAVQRTKGRRAEPTDDIGVLEAGSMAAPAAEEPAIEGFERSVVARAFASLPERWQAVLWHCEIEGLTPAEIAPLLGLSANSTAALAYRAREGLRQAYLQQHLQDPLAGACRTVAGKLGGYVRGGLGARDTAQVESHLEDCGECRGLVLELRDVNHGLRAIVAPLVLGFVGLGALKFALPTTGGLAAGTASLAAGGTTSGAAAGIAGGAGAASSTASGAGVVSGVGAGVAGAGASGGAASSMFGAVAGLLASVPTALVAGIAAVAVVAGVTVGALAISNGRGEPAAANPIGTATSSAAGSAVGATGDPSLPDGAATAGAGSTGGATSGAAALSGIGLSPVGGSPSTPAPSTSAGTPLLVVADPIGGLVLNAGDSGQVLAVDVTNTGTAPATSLVASVALPAGVVPDVVTQVAGRLTVHVAAASWSCRVTGGGVSCTLPVLDVGAVTRLAVQVGAAQDFAGGDVTWRIDGAGLRAAVSHPSRVTALPWVSSSSPTTGTPTTTPTSTPTTTPTSTPTPTTTPTSTPTPTPTPKPTPTPTSTPTPTPTSTPTSAPTPTPTPTPTGPPRCQQGQPWSWWCWHGWHR